MSKSAYFFRGLFVVIVFCALGFYAYIQDENTPDQILNEDSTDALFNTPAKADYLYCVNIDSGSKLVLKSLSQKLNFSVTQLNSKGKKLDSSKLALAPFGTVGLILESNTKLVKIDSNGSDLLAFIETSEGLKSECKNNTSETWVIPGFSTEKDAINNLLISNPYKTTASLDVFVVGSSRESNDSLALQREVKNIVIDANKTYEFDFNQLIKRSELVFVKILTKSGSVIPAGSTTLGESNKLLPLYSSESNINYALSPELGTYSVYNPSTNILNVDVNGQTILVPPNSATLKEIDGTKFLKAESDNGFYFLFKSGQNLFRSFSKESSKFYVYTSSPIEINNSNDGEVQCDYRVNTDPPKSVVVKPKSNASLEMSVDSLVKLECDLPVSVFSTNSVIRSIVSR
jgi:hypothetical protein